MLSAPAFSQVSEPGSTEDTIHYAYAALFGTGVYRLDDRTVTVLRIPFSYNIRDAEPGRPGIRALFPVSLGSHRFDFDDIFDIEEEDVSTVSFVPGLRLTFKVRQDWEVSSSANFGYGRDFDNGVSSTIYGAAVSSNYLFAESRYQYRFGTEALGAGYRPDGGSNRVILRLGAGIDAKVPTQWTWGGSAVFLNPQLITYFYSREAEFNTVSMQRDFFDVQTEIQVGLAIGRDKPLRVLGFRFDRIGIGYRYSDNVQGIKLFTQFPF